MIQFEPKNNPSKFDLSQTEEMINVGHKKLDEALQFIQHAQEIAQEFTERFGIKEGIFCPMNEDVRMMIASLNPQLFKKANGRRLVRFVNTDQSVCIEVVSQELLQGDMKMTAYFTRAKKQVGDKIYLYNQETHNWDVEDAEYSQTGEADGKQ